MILKACLSIIECSDDIIRGRERRDELLANSRNSSQPGDVQRWTEYLDDVRRGGGALPGMVHGARTLVGRKYLSGLLNVNTGLIGLRNHWSDIPIHAGAPLDTEIRCRIDGQPWTDTIDYFEVDALVERLVTACYIVTTYLSGMRPEESRGLARGCCRKEDPGDETAGYEVHGKVFKHRGTRATEPRDHVWAVIDPVARAIEVVEKLHSRKLLFAATTFAIRKPVDGNYAVTDDRINQYIRRLIEWWNLRAGQRGWVTIPAEPEGPTGRVPNVTASRFRRTVAWFVFRRPQGLIALGWQYGHIDLRQSAAYGSRINSGIGEVLEEFLFAQRDAVEERVSGMESGEGVSGPSAEIYLGRLQEHRQTFPGQIVSQRDFEALLRNPATSIFHSEKQCATCCFDPTQALCLQGEDGEANIEQGPVLRECQAQCPNLVRTDTDIERVDDEIRWIDEQVASPIVPEPIKWRLRQIRPAFISDRAGELLELEADHRRHAEIENAIRDLKYGVGLNHLPSGRFAANAAWLAVQVIAHNLARWTARLGLGAGIVTTRTLRRRYFALAGRLTHSARRWTLHLAKRWPWAGQWAATLARLRALPLPA